MEIQVYDSQDYQYDNGSTMKRILRSSLLLKTLLVLYIYCSSAHAEKTLRVIMHTTMGEIELELFPEEAPVTVKNFLSYVQKDYYNGTIFHRVIEDFMIQGGGFTSDMTPKKTDPPIKNESPNQLSNERGTIAMARTSDPDSATSQFFINQIDNISLDAKKDKPGYAVFGRIVSGMETVDTIAAVKTTTLKHYKNVPEKPIIINRITVAEATQIEDVPQSSLRERIKSGLQNFLRKYTE